MLSMWEELPLTKEAVVSIRKDSSEIGLCCIAQVPGRQAGLISDIGNQADQIRLNKSYFAKL